MSHLEAGVISGNYYDKYNAKNWVARRLTSGFQRSLLELARKTGCRDVHEIGCGEGHLARQLARAGFSVRASDFSRQVIEEAVRITAREQVQVSFKVASIADLQREHDCADVVVCCEVLEHLQDPAEGLRLLAELARKRAIFSVPLEPVWRVLNVARLKYLSSWGNTPGHVQHWSRASFVRFIQSRFVVEEVRSPFPWTMVLARPATAPRWS